MCEDHQPVSSFGEPNAHPQTQTQTPNSSTSPSPVFETPKPYQGSFTDASGGQTPCYAEEYSVFDDTAGNLRGFHSPFLDYIPVTLTSTYADHKRSLSAEGLVGENSVHIRISSQGSTAASVSATSAHCSEPLPDASTVHKSSLLEDSKLPLSSVPIKTHIPSKRIRLDTAIEKEPTQVISPPPTAHKGGRRQALKLNMQDDQRFEHSDIQGPPQHDLATFIGSTTDMFGYPMSAPATATPNFWDPAFSMSMDLDFASGTNVFQPSITSSHRQTGSFDWNNESPLFQDTNLPPSSNQENIQPTRQEKILAPKLSSDNARSDVSNAPLSVTYAPAMDDSFGVLSADAVDPGLLLSRPHSACMDTEFRSIVQSGSAEAAIVQSGRKHTVRLRMSRGGREPKTNARGPDRAIASSPVKGASRPGLVRTSSENRDVRLVRRGSLPLLVPAARPPPGSGIVTSSLAGRLSGRISPFKTRDRLPSLASIPETSPHARSRASVRLTIDACGRARAETTLLGEGTTTMTRSRSSHNLSARRSWSSLNDESDTDDEPITIPSRNNSFNTSFTLPNPRKPAGVVYDSLRQSATGRSNTNSLNDGESEAETVFNERPSKVGDAANELRKVVESRQKKSLRLGRSRSQRLLTTNLRNFPGGIISPTSLTESSYGQDSYGVRCICSHTKTDERDEFMVQCESCEMWLHGKCINITRRTLPSMYLCGFCVNTPKVTGRRMRDNALGIGSALSPLTNKSLKSFR